MIVFGSEYRTAHGTVKPGISAHKLLLGGPLGDRRRPGRPAREPGGQRQHRRRHRRGRRGRPRRPPRASPPRSAATVAEHGSGPLDLLVVGSRPEAPAGKVVLSAASDYAVEAANYPVLVVPRGVALDFAAAPPRRRAPEERPGGRRPYA